MVKNFFFNPSKQHTCTLTLNSRGSCIRENADSALRIDDSNFSALAKFAVIATFENFALTSLRSSLFLLSSPRATLRTPKLPSISPPFLSRQPAIYNVHGEFVQQARCLPARNSIPHEIASRVPQSVIRLKPILPFIAIDWTNRAHYWLLDTPSISTQWVRHLKILLLPEFAAHNCKCNFSLRFCCNKNISFDVHRN